MNFPLQIEYISLRLFVVKVDLGAQECIINKN